MKQCQARKLHFSQFDLLVITCIAVASAGKPKEHVQALNISNFHEFVNVTDPNITYHPFVMFHLSTCEICKETMPIFHKTGKKVYNEVRAGKLGKDRLFPKFFSMNCDGEETEEICAPLTRGAYPTLLFFRNNHSYKFDRPRTIDVMVWWVERLTRHPVLEPSTQEHLANLGWAEPCMTLFLASGMKKEKREEVYRAWVDISYDYIETYNFALVRDGQLTRLAGGNPNGSLTVHAHEDLGYDAVLPFEKPFTKKRMKDWVHFNRFPTVLSLMPYNLEEVMKAGLPVVALVHWNDADALEFFKQQVIPLRPSKRFLFAQVNMSFEVATELVSVLFPLVSFNLPRVFIFDPAVTLQNVSYYFDVKVLNMDNVTLASITEVHGNPEARHGGSEFKDFWSERFYLYSQMITSSWHNLFMFLGFISVVVAVFFHCLKALFGSKADARPAAKAKAKAKGEAAEPKEEKKDQ